MSNKKRNKRVGIGLMVAAVCIVLLGLWAVLATPEIAQAKKPGGGGQPEVLHGAAEFEEKDSEGNAYAIQSDGLGPYVDGVDFTELGLEGFFRLRIHLKNDAGRELDLTFPDISSEFLPTTQNIWILWLEGSLANWREPKIGDSVLRMGNLLIGQTGKDEAGISYGRWGPDGEGLKGDLLTVTRIDTDVWTIESPATDSARFYRQTGKEWEWYELAPMPFKVTYYGQ